MMKILGVILGTIFGALLVILIFPIMIGIFLLIATVFLIAQLTGKPIEIKHDDVVIGHVRRFKYTSVKKDSL